jgi:hypothetical protein
MEYPPAYAVGQRVRALSNYHRGEVGTVIRRHGAAPTPAYVVEFAGGACVFLREHELKPSGVDGSADRASAAPPLFCLQLRAALLKSTDRDGRQRRGRPERVPAPDPFQRHVLHARTPRRTP